MYFVYSVVKWIADFRFRGIPTRSGNESKISLSPIVESIDIPKYGKNKSEPQQHRNGKMAAGRVKESEDRDERPFGDGDVFSNR